MSCLNGFYFIFVCLALFELYFSTSFLSPIDFNSMNFETVSHVPLIDDSVVLYYDSSVQHDFSKNMLNRFSSKLLKRNVIDKFLNKLNSIL